MTTPCDGVVIIHTTGWATCTEAACPSIRDGNFVHNHVRFVPCHAVFVDEPCPPCAGTVQAGGHPSSPYPSSPWSRPG